MKNKKLIMYVGIIIFVLIIIIIGYVIYNNVKNKSSKIIFEYTPEQEITEEQLRQTVITLYFLDPDTYEIVPEARQIDAKLLIDNPYELLINLLIEGPKNEKLMKVIPEKVILNSAKIEQDILYLDFSKDFIEGQNLGKEQEEIIIESIVNTVTELTEINKVVILIDGNAELAFPDEGVSFNKVFTRE
ncbi:MAG: GerMN domain-containing protein [Clostridia bacterium]|nr:GerMN domain-containing protein [Clostridia bacterium]